METGGGLPYWLVRSLLFAPLLTYNYYKKKNKQLKTTTFTLLRRGRGFRVGISSISTSELFLLLASTITSRATSNLLVAKK